MRQRIVAGGVIVGIFIEAPIGASIRLCAEGCSDPYEGKNAS